MLYHRTLQLEAEHAAPNEQWPTLCYTYSVSHTCEKHLPTIRAGTSIQLYGRRLDASRSFYRAGRASTSCSHQRPVPRL
jgi:hypothetical protein